MQKQYKHSKCCTLRQQMIHPKHTQIRNELQDLWDNEITITKFCLGHGNKPAVFSTIDEDVNLILNLGYKKYNDNEFLIKCLN